MILNMSGGGAPLNFKIVGGTSEPTVPTENTIWVNTDVEITGWIFSADEPETPDAGTVWIETTKKSPVSFNALKKNGIMVYPIRAKQYVCNTTSEWESKTAKTYQNGAWADWWSGELYDSGDLFESITGGWESSDGNIRWTFESALIKYTSTSTSSNYAVLYTKNPVDITDFTTLNIDINITTVGDGEKILINSNNTDRNSDTAHATTSKTGRQTLSLDISSFSGEYYIGFRANLSKGEIYKIWLS